MREKRARSNEKTAQEAAADKLQQQIDALVRGQVPAGPPRSLRDFVERETLTAPQRRGGQRQPARDPARQKKT